MQLVTCRVMRLSLSLTSSRSSPSMAVSSPRRWLMIWIWPEIIESGHHDHLDPGIEKLQAFQHFHAGHSGHADVQHGDIDWIGLRQRDSRGSIAGEQDIEFIFEKHSERLSRAFFVVDGEHGGLVR